MGLQALAGTALSSRSGGNSHVGRMEQNLL